MFRICDIFEFVLVRRLKFCRQHFVKCSPCSIGCLPVPPLQFKDCHRYEVCHAMKVDMRTIASSSNDCPQSPRSSTLLSSGFAFNQVLYLDILFFCRRPCCLARFQSSVVRSNSIFRVSVTVYRHYCRQTQTENRLSYDVDIHLNMRSPQSSFLNFQSVIPPDPPRNTMKMCVIEYAILIPRATDLCASESHCADWLSMPNLIDSLSKLWT